MSKAVLISISIFYMASWWNDYYLTMIYIRDPEKYTLPVRIIQMITNVEDSSVYSAQDAVYAKLSAYGVRAAGIVLSAVPMLLLIPLMQRIDIASITKHKK
jgi:ABC-type glycerol-3-phosphate transport system permease component